MLPILAVGGVERAIMDKVVLEQVFQAIPTAVRSWLMRNGTTSLAQAAAYLENYFLAKRCVRPEGGAQEQAPP